MQTHGPLSHVYTILMRSTVQRYKTNSKKKFKKHVLHTHEPNELEPSFQLGFPTRSFPYYLCPTLNSYGVTGELSRGDEFPNSLLDECRRQISYEKILQRR